MLNAGVDGLLIETVTSIRNLQPMLAGARDAADGMPVLVSFVVDDKGDLLGDGLNIEAAVLYAEKHGANSVGVNCCSLAAANAAVPRMVASATTPVTVRPNAGNPVQTQDGPVWHEDPEAFARACVEWKRAGAAWWQLLRNHGGYDSRYGRCAQYIEPENGSIESPPPAGAVFLLAVRTSTLLPKR